jgi:hypothetical protein
VKGRREPESRSAWAVEEEAVADLTRLLRVLWDAYNDELDEAAGAAFEDLCAEHGLDAYREWARLDDDRYKKGQLPPAGGP